MRGIVLSLTSVVVALLLACAVSVIGLDNPAQAAFPGKNGKIAFDRSFRIWVKNPSLDAVEKKLRDDGTSDGQPAFSPDGSRVAFVRRVPGAEIFVTNADGSGTPRQLTNNAVVDSNPVWSHDGTRIAFERGGQVWSMNADGTAEKQLTGLPTDSAEFNNREPSFSPAWSVPLSGAPDGKIVFVHGGHLWTMLADGSAKDQLNYTCPTENGGVCDNAVGNPTFSPDGSKIAAEYYGDIFIVSSSGGTSTLLLAGLNTEFPGGEGNPAWSPDGTKIIFEHSAGTPAHIYMANADGSSTQPIQLTNGSVGEVNPDWQPIPQCNTTDGAPNSALAGTPENDNIRGTAGNDVICGLGGDDTINGLGGNDIILGGGGGDRLTGDLGNDTLNGGTGADTVLYSGSARVIANLTTEFARGVGLDVLLGIENLSGSSEKDALTGSASTANVLKGLGGNDVLNVRDGTGGDTADGGTGTDTCKSDAADSIRSCER